MKIVSLNTWGGRAGKEGMLNFFEKNQNIDVFCLQEIWSAPYDDYEGVAAGGLEIKQETIMTEGMQDISAVLQNHVPLFRPHFLDSYGLLMLVRKELEIIQDGEVFVHLHKGYMPVGDIGNHARNIQYVTIQTSAGVLTIVNFHGLWNGKGKGDCEERLQQTDNIIEFLGTLGHPYVLCGDFNLLPNTESIAKFEHAGMRNLIREYDITSTRTDLYTKPEKFADYAFVSKDVEVAGFKVLTDQVSDHAPLFIEVV